MPAELMHLNEQLLNLKIVYENAVFSDMPLADIKKIGAQVKDIEQKIEDRKEYVQRQHSYELRRREQGLKH